MNSYNLKLTDVLQLAENIETTKEYKYIEQKSINGKPDIFYTGENLKRYPLKVTLHNSFCNIENILSELEKYGKNQQTISYYQNNNYIGEYVIEKYNIDIEKKYLNTIIYAKLSITLLEGETFEQKNKIKINYDNIEKLTQTQYKQFIKKLENIHLNSYLTENYFDLSNYTTEEKLVLTNLLKSFKNIKPMQIEEKTSECINKLNGITGIDTNKMINDLLRASNNYIKNFFR